MSKNKNILSKTDNKVVNITLAGFCAVCWKKSQHYCSSCYLIGYCCFSHMANHWSKHKCLCKIANILINKTGFLYAAEINNPDEWRYFRLKTLQNVNLLLQRDLEPHERDLILFPKHCSFCYETDIKKLDICKECHQVWFCRNKLDHFPKNHADWCQKLQLFSTLIQKQAKGELFMYDMNFQTDNSNVEFNINETMEDIIEKVVNSKEKLDKCQIAMISQAASGPLTVLYVIRNINLKIKKILTIHLIGAELYYEGCTLQAWETFFLHFLQVVHLKIIMVGPELNASCSKESLRLCDKCKKKKRTISIEYKNGLLYHEYNKGINCNSVNIVCAFNPGLHRTTGYNQRDTWPETISAAVSTNIPFLITSYTALEGPIDLKRIQENANVNVIQQPMLNPFASLKPDRNFISDHEAPLIFKNYYLSVVCKA